MILGILATMDGMGALVMYRNVALSQLNSRLVYIVFLMALEVPQRTLVARPLARKVTIGDHLITCAVLESNPSV
jgi:hypothetical protein